MSWFCYCGDELGVRMQEVVCYCGSVNAESVVSTIRRGSCTYSSILAPICRASTVQLPVSCN